MQHLLCCWELGGGNGHLYRLRGLIDQLPQNQIQTSLAAADLAGAAELFPAAELIQVPFCSAPPRDFGESLNFSQNLLRVGYWHAGALRGALRAWLALFERCSPDALLIDFAPGALLAARIAGLPAVAVGSGWSLPPLGTPMPTLQPWFPIPESKLREHETELLTALGGALVEFGAKPLDSLPELFGGCERLLTFDAELDHYEHRDGEHYLGPVSAHVASRATDALPDAEIFVYIDRGYRHLERLCETLRERGTPTHASIRGATAEFCLSVSGGCLTTRPDPVSLPAVLERCSLVICHGGVGLSGATLAAGKRLITLPQHLEQSVLGYRLGRRGLATSVGRFDREPDFRAKIDEALADDAMLESVERFSRARNGRDNASAARVAAERVLSTMKAGLPS